jgi:hypothetical protein
MAPLPAGTLYGTFFAGCQENHRAAFLPPRHGGAAVRVTHDPRPAALAPAVTAPALPVQRALLGILFMCLSGLLFPVMGGFAKILGAEYSSPQVSWAAPEGAED